MVTLRLQRRLASSVLKCGKNKVWMDNKETSEIALATTRGHIKKLVKDGIILRRAHTVHSRFRTRTRLEEKQIGANSGDGTYCSLDDAKVKAMYDILKPIYDAQGVKLKPLQRTLEADALRYQHVTVEIDRAGATLAAPPGEPISLKNSTLAL